MKYGKIATALLIILVLAAVIFVSILPKVQAATYSSRTICIDNWINQTQLSNPYLILYDLATGNLVNASTGAVSASTTWANAAFDEGHYTAHSVSGYPVFTIPALSSEYIYRALILDGASPANSDTVYARGFYDPRTSSFYTDSNPIGENAVVVRQAQEIP